MREDKQEKLARVAKSITGIVARFGFDSLTPSRLARAAQVSRPWVYKYIGGSKEALANFAVDHFGKLLTQLDASLKPSSVEFFESDETKRLEVALEFADENPEVIQIYYRYKGTPTIMGRAIEKIEEEYRKAKYFQIKETFKVTDQEAKVYAEILQSLKMGLCHQWVTGTLKADTSREEFLQIIAKTFHIFFSKIPAPETK